jgi:hypothetical protein
MFDKHDESFPYLEGYVVTQSPVEHAFQRVNGDGDFGRQGNRGDCPVEFPQRIGLTEQKKKRRCLYNSY